VLVAELRRDEQRIPLLDLVSATVGEPDCFLLAIREGHVTVRLTTDVRAINRIGRPTGTPDEVAG
jgi:hypothetical protein